MAWRWRGVCGTPPTARRRCWWRRPASARPRIAGESPRPGSIITSSSRTTRTRCSRWCESASRTSDHVGLSRHSQQTSPRRLRLNPERVIDLGAHEFVGHLVEAIEAGILGDEHAPASGLVIIAIADQQAAVTRTRRDGIAQRQHALDLGELLIVDAGMAGLPRHDPVHL